MVLTVLKAKHSLVGRSMIPIIIEMKGSDDMGGDGQFARLKKDHPLEHYNMEELTSEFKKLTGENVADILTLAGKQMEEQCIRYCMHLAIIHANAAGAPKGQTLTEQTQAAATSKNADSPVTSSNGNIRITSIDRW